MHKLTFKSNKTLKSLARETLDSKEFHLPYTKETTNTKSFFLVKDEGIYLMDAFCHKDKLKYVVYAQRYNPKYDLKGDLWERTYEVSRDDFGENIPFEEEALMRIASGGDITINLSETQIEVMA